MQKISELSDLELIRRYKETNEERYKTILYERYKNLVKKLYYKGLSWQKNVLDIEDFLQEAYFVCEKAINYVNFDKITDLNTWHFMSTYRYFLLSKINKLNLKEIKTSSVGTDVHDLIKLGKLTLKHNESPIDNLIFENFLQTLPEKERYICFSRYNIGKETITMRKLAKELNCSKSWVLLLDKNIKKKWLQYST